MKDAEEYDYTYIVYSEGYGGTYDVKGVGTYDEPSVLAGQSKIVFLDSYKTLEEAVEHYPEATVTNKIMEPRNTTSHLPDNGDGW